MKLKALFICGVFLLLLCLSACNTQGNNDTTATTTPIPEPPAPEQTVEKNAEMLEIEAFIADYLGADSFSMTDIRCGQFCNCDVPQGHNTLTVVGDKTVDGVTENVRIVRWITREVVSQIWQCSSTCDIEGGLLSSGMAELIRAYVLYGEGATYHAN